MRYWWLILVVILIVGAYLRLARLGSYPLGLHFDEASIAYNAWAISVWHRDEWANFMPLSFRSFGDHKPPLVIYLLAGAYWLFGLQIIWVRGLSALAGTLSIGIIFFIAREIGSTYGKYLRASLRLTSDFQLKILPLLAALLLSLSIWGITLSRVGYEQNTAFLLVNWGVWWLFLGLRRPRWFIYAAIPISLSMYAFHTAKIFWLGFLPLFLIINRTELRSVQATMVKAVMLGSILLLPLGYDMFLGEGNSRARSLIIFDQSGQTAQFTDMFTELATNTLKYLSWRFWVEGEDAVSLRHVVPGHGVLTVVEWMLLTAGIGWCLKGWSRSQMNQMLISWWVVGLLPGILARGAPHALRSLFALTPSILLSIIGGLALFKVLKSYRSWLAHGFLGAIFFFYIIGIGAFWRSYLTTYQQRSAPAFQFGYEQVFNWINEHRQGGDKIVITDSYGQPYIYALLYNSITPQKYHFGALNDFVFMPIRWPTNEKQRIYIGLPNEIPIDDPHVKKTITIPGTDQVILVIAQT